MSTMAERATATQTYQVYIKATPEAIWDALTNAERTVEYGYRGQVDYDLRPGGAYIAYATEEMLSRGAPDAVIEGEILEVDAPRRLVQTWDARFDEATGAEASTRLSFEIEDSYPGVTKLTLTHALDGAPILAELVSGA